MVQGISVAEGQPVPAYHSPTPAWSSTASPRASLWDHPEPGPPFTFPTVN